MQLTDATGTDAQDALAVLLQLHRRHFPTHGHVLVELEANAVHPMPTDDLVVHQVLATVDDVPAGFIVVHANLARSIGIVHFLAVEEQFRGVPLGSTPRSTVAAFLVEAGEDLVTGDGTRLGRPVRLGMVAESDIEVTKAWKQWGYAPLNITYAEPYFGRQWADHGPPEFFDMALVSNAARNVPDAIEKQDPSPAEVARAASEAFLVDHYRLDPDHPRVRATFASIDAQRG